MPNDNNRPCFKRQSLIPLSRKVFQRNLIILQLAVGLWIKIGQRHTSINEGTTSVYEGCELEFDVGVFGTRNRELLHIDDNPASLWSYSE